MSEPGCADVRELIPELAAGLAPGDERAAAMAHITGCRDCGRELAAVADLVDELVLLAPGEEPPAGFESRVLAALAPRPRRRGLRGPWAWVAAGAAAVALVAAAAGGTWWWTGADRHLAAQYRQTLATAEGRYLTAADVRTPEGAEAGDAFAYEGTPSWVFVTLTDAPEPGDFTLHIVTRAGRDVVTGAVCHVAGGAGSCGASVSVHVSDIARVELRAPGAGVLTAALRR